MAIQRCLVLVAALFLNVVTIARCWSLGSASTADCSRLWRQLQGSSSSATCSRGARRPNSTRVITMNRSRKGQAQIEDFSKAMNKVKDFVEDVPPLAQDPGLGEILTIARAADARKAQNINALRVAQLTIVTNFMVVLEGTSRPQNQAIAASIIEAMEEEHGRVTKQQGTPDRSVPLCSTSSCIEMQHTVHWMHRYMCSCD
eukprot:TRINITY_DN718_c0_g1_i3.p1 TRINITY_DN718_c0_g1~~TRINITY_DN718_c0_g1_i3.p1  ORF type:complete len:211 (-),score=38.37 TRINITY_DN718_c0_g1_i3:1395-1997(-)